METRIYENASMVFTRSESIQRSVVVHYGISPDKAACVYVGPNTDHNPAETTPRPYEAKRLLFAGMD